MGENFCGILIKLLMTLGLFKCVLAGGFVEIKLLTYSAACTEFFWGNACDPTFTFCLDRPRISIDISPCYYNTTAESDYFQDSNDINFSGMTRIGGIPNPWITYTNQLKDPLLRFAIRVQDKDVFGSEYLTTIVIILRETVYPNKESALWTVRQMARDYYTVKFQIRIYCEPNYYSDCSVYCLAADNFLGHYTCDPVTGRKICMKGWTGEDCNEDIDECGLDYCRNGECENLPADYICHCPVNYRGKNCSVRVYPCDSKPCQNNATCLNGWNMDYSCKCVGNWTGYKCDIKA